MARKKRNLVYTLALDPAGATGHRNLAKMLVSSLLRTRFSGDILVFHNSPAPLFMVAREGVREVRMKVPAKAGKNGGFVTYAQSCKHAVAEHIVEARWLSPQELQGQQVFPAVLNERYAADRARGFSAAIRVRLREMHFW